MYLLKRLVFFPSSIGNHGDLLLAFHVLTWTMHLWWTLCKMSLRHFDVRSFVSKMCMAVPLTSNRQNSSQIFLRVCLLGYNPQFGLSKIPFFLLNWMVNWILMTLPCLFLSLFYHESDLLCFLLCHYLVFSCSENFIPVVRCVKDMLDNSLFTRLGPAVSAWLVFWHQHEPAFTWSSP